MMMMLEPNTNRQNQALRQMVLGLKARLHRAADIVRAAQVDRPMLLELRRLKQLERSVQEYQPGWCVHRDTHGLVAIMRLDFIKQNEQLYGALQAIFAQARLTPGDPDLIRETIEREFYSLTAEV